MIRIPDTTYSRLQSLAKPFVDTPASVIDMLLDYYEQARAGREPDIPVPRKVARTGVRQFAPDDAPELVHTRFIAGNVNNVTIRNWNRLLDEAHRAAVSQGASSKELVSISLSHVVVGKETDRGFRHLSDINVSIQGVDSGSAWKHALHLAKKYKFPLTAHFAWRDKSGAAYPGEQGELSWSPKP